MVALCSLTYCCFEEATKINKLSCKGLNKNSLNEPISIFREVLEEKERVITCNRGFRDVGNSKVCAYELKKKWLSSFLTPTYINQCWNSYQISQFIIFDTYSFHINIFSLFKFDFPFCAHFTFLYHLLQVLPHWWTDIMFSTPNLLFYRLMIWISTNWIRRSSFLMIDGLQHLIVSTLQWLGLY